MMHPIERLRMVARAGREDSTMLGREAASALAAFGDQPAALVTACRRLVGRQPACAPVWWVAARVLAAGDPVSEAWRAGDELADDPTSSVLAAALPEESTVVVVGWPEQAADALTRRGDAEVLVIDALEEGGQMVRSLRRAGVESALVPESGTAAAVARCRLVLLDAFALGPTGLVAAAGSAAAAAVARQLAVPVWAVAGAGRVLPGPLWEALVATLEARGPAWAQAEEMVPLGWVDAVAGPSGIAPAADALGRPTCPAVPELTRHG